MLYANATGLALTQSQGNTLLVKLSQTQGAWNSHFFFFAGFGFWFYVLNCVGEQASTPKSIEEINPFIELHHLDLNLIRVNFPCFFSSFFFFFILSSFLCCTVIIIL
jgi:hypothetical protein